MLQRTASKFGCFCVVGLFAAWLSSCGSGETPSASPDEQEQQGQNVALAAPGKASLPDASQAADVRQNPGNDAGDDTSATVDDASSTPVPETPRALGVLASLRARFTVKVPPDPREDDPGNGGTPNPGPPDGGVGAQVTVPMLGAGAANRFDKGPGGVVPSFPAQVGPRAARVTLSKTPIEPLRLEDAATGMAVEVTLRDGRDAPAEAAQGYLVYQNGHASGATLLHRALADGVEDYVSFDNRPAAPTIAYDVALRQGVRGLRLVANMLEMLDGDGTPRLRISPPTLMGVNGRAVEASLSVDNCAYDVDPAPPWGRAVVAPGADSCTVRVIWTEDGLVYPALLDPKWSTTGSMSRRRTDHTATLLSNGKVLVTGGNDGTSVFSSAELYDRTTGTWTATGSMTGARMLHTATQLGTSSNATTSGKVLVAGGFDGSNTLSTAQLYSPTAGTWTAAANLNAARKEHSATLLANGKVLVVGGASGSTTLNTAAVYNPASGTGSWAAVGNMATARKYHSATLLVTSNATLNNKVLVVGGRSSTASLTSVQLFDGTSSWSTLTALSSAREQHTATVVANGKLLVAGGKNGTTTLATTLVFNPASGSGSWTSGGNMTSARHGHSATLLSSTVLNNGQLLVAGGWNGSVVLSSAELWNGTSTWTLTTPLPVPVKYQTDTLLSSGIVLIAGGVDAAVNPVSTAYQYDPSRGSPCTTSTQCASGFCANGVCCNTACADECGACNLTGLAGTCSPKGNGTTCADEGNPCTADKCNGSSLSCQHPAGNAGAICRPALNDCDLNETCTGTSTICPVDSKATNGTACNDGNACTTADQCAAGTCVGGAPPVIDDGNACTADSCAPTSGPIHTPLPAGTSCQDGNVCNGNEVCNASGSCTAGTPPVVDDGNPCTVDSCNPSTGVHHDPAPAGTSCSDGNICNGQEICNAGGACMPGTPIVIDDGNRCTADACDPVLGVTHAPLPAGTSCADGTTCVGGTCDGAGSCVGCGSCTDGVRNGDETGVDCGGSCPACPSGGVCETDSDCASGLVCGTNNGACFGRVPRGTKVCWPATCEGGGNKAACGAADSACGMNCDCVNPCQPSDAGPACPTGEVCKQAGAVMQTRVADVCVDPRCPSNDPALCGTPTSLCGQTCVCTSNCSSATCANPSDGCGGICPGVCGPGATGCTVDLNCPPGFACIPGDDGTRTCRPGDCTFKLMAPPLCGSPGAPCGDQCPACVPRCDGRQCGPDPNCGKSCGTCDGPGMFCDTSGQCRAPVPRPPIIGPDGGPIVVTPPPPPPSTVGALPGGFSVSEQGTAAYSVPIDVPPGRAGMQPAISLNYGGRANGDLGVGWHLEGLSQITRCPRSQSLDGYSDPVRNTTGDHFCIDGKRLETVAGVGGGAPGAYGFDGTEYRTLIDSFARTVSYQSPGDGVQLDLGFGVVLRLPRVLQGPDYFKVWTKDGRILTYGGTRDSLVMARNGMRYGWLLTQAEDRAGNTMTFNYLNVNAMVPALFSLGVPNLIRIDSISYTGHGNDPGNRKVAFKYEERSDPQHKFMQAGVPFMSSQRLARIITYVENQPVKNYRLFYGDFGPTHFSQIARIFECTGDNDTYCKRPTQFEYEADLAVDTGSAPSVADKENVGKFDASGDGIPDYLEMKATVHPVEADPWLAVAQIVTDVAIGVASGGAGTIGSIAISAAWSQASPGFWGMLAKDPVIDIKGSMHIGTGNRTLPTTFVSNVHGLPCGGRDASWMLDYDRDGMDDVVGACLDTALAYGIHVSRSTGHGDFVPIEGAVATVPLMDECNTNPPPNYACLPGFQLPRPMFVDIDGDSLEDLLYCQNHETLGMRRRITPSAGFEATPLTIRAPLCADWRPTFNIFDVDGDGTTDFLVYNERDGWQTLRYSRTGSGPSAVSSLRWQTVQLPDVKNSRKGAGMSLGDFNGDGLLDIYARPLPPDPFAPITPDPWPNPFPPSPPPPPAPANDPNVVIWLNGGDNRFSSRTLARPLPALDNPDPLFGAFSFQQQAVIDHDADGRTDILESWIARGSTKAHFFNVALLPNSAVTRLDWVDPNYVWRDGPNNDGPFVPGGFRLAADLDGDGNADLFGNKQAFYRSGQRNRLLSRVVDGAGRLTTIKYDQDYPSATYTNTGEGACRGSWPDTCLKRMKGLVSSHDEGYVTSNGNDAVDVIERSYEYTYVNAHMSVTGQGWLGFERRKMRSFVNDRLLQDVTTDYAPPSEAYTPAGQKIVAGIPYNPPYLYPLAGLPAVVTVDNYPLDLPGAEDPGHIETGLYVRRSRVETQWTVKQSAFGRPFPFTESRLTQTFDRVLPALPPAPPFEDNGMLLTFCAQVNESDGYGNVTSARERCQGNNDGPEEESLTINSPEIHVADWLVSNFNQIAKVSTRGGETQSQEWTYFYYPNGLLQSVTRAPENVAARQTDYERDDYGNPTTVTEKEFTGEADRVTRIVYDDESIFPKTITNAKNQPTELRFDARWGTPTVTKDPNGIPTSRAYDDFGRLVRTTGPRGTTFISYSDAQNALEGRVQHIQTIVESEGTEGSRTGSQTREYDHNGQVLKTITEGKGGDLVFQHATYDNLGRLLTRTLPRTEPDPLASPKDSFLYDRLHRIKSVVHADGTHSDYRYATSATLDAEHYNWFYQAGCDPTPSARTCVVDFIYSRDEEGRETVRITDHRGLIVRTIDGDNVHAIEPQSNKYEYGPFNRLRYGTDTGGHVTEFVTDAYGRRTDLFDPDTYLNGSTHSEFSGYDELKRTTDPKNQTRIFHHDVLGRLESIDDQTVGTTAWTYDEGINGIGRLSATISPPTEQNPNGNRVSYSYEPGARGFVRQIDTTLDNTVYTSSFDYDDAGRIDRIHYPDLGNGPPIVVKYRYDASGVMTNVDEVGGTTPRSLWQFDEAFEGHLVQRETFGNDASTQYHYNAQRRWIENIQTATSAGVVQSLEYVRYNNGLVRFRNTNTSQREYTYDNLNRLFSSIDTPAGGTAQETPYRYDAIGNITTRGSTTLSYHDTQPHLLLEAGGNAYGYDANGNVAFRGGPSIPGGAQSFDYTPFDLPSAIHTGSGPDSKTTLFEYTADQERVIRRDTDTTRYFVGALYQRVVTTGTTDTVEERFALSAGGRQFGEIVRKHDTDETLYFHVDHQGTVDTITRDGGAFQTQTFDPFGAPSDPPISEPTRFGFTGHQHDNDLGLIDMRGRIYDPLAARFTTADPMMQAPFGTQGLNRYSYVFNDPVNSADPTGFEAIPIDEDILFSTLNVHATAPLNWSSGCGACAIWEGASSSVATNGIAGIAGAKIAAGLGAAVATVVGDLLNPGLGGARAGGQFAMSVPSAGPKSSGVGAGIPDAGAQNRGGVGGPVAGPTDPNRALWCVDPSSGIKCGDNAARLRNPLERQLDEIVRDLARQPAPDLPEQTLPEATRLGRREYGQMNAVERGGTVRRGPVVTQGNPLEVEPTIVGMPGDTMYLLVHTHFFSPLHSAQDILFARSTGIRVVVVGPGDMMLMYNPGTNEQFLIPP